MINMITAEEKEIIDLYRATYAFSYGAHKTPNATFASCEHFLRLWQEAKSNHLIRMFDNNLILERDFSYSRSDDEILEDINKMFYKGRGRKNRMAFEFKNAFYRFCESEEGYAAVNKEHFAHNNLYSLMYSENLKDNCYTGNSFNIKLPNGKDYKVRDGVKTIRVLGKIAEAFNLKGFEDFRICHSMVVGQKQIAGKMKLSIHPLDYMTMSDNNSGWDSCMSWHNEGGYRHGTIEMMNSPTVVVAYLASDEDMETVGGYHWNNKRWRQLFIVDKNAIIAVKEYPFYNEELTRFAAEWLKELAIKNLQWDYEDFFKYNVCADDDNEVLIHRDYLPSNKNDFAIELNCGFMYNDFGTTENGRHYIALATEIDPENISEWELGYYKKKLFIPYSGLTECVVCGDKFGDYDDESCLACNNCQTVVRCDCCGERVDESYTIDDMVLCACCYESRVHTCDVTGEEHYEDELTCIYVIPRLTEDEENDNLAFYKENYGMWGFDESKKYIYMPHRPTTYIFHNYHKMWEEKCLNPGEEAFTVRKNYQFRTCVYADQLTPETLLRLTGSKTVEEYKNSFGGMDIYPVRFLEII